LFENDAESLVSARDVFGIVAASAVCVLLPVFSISHDCPAMVMRRESAGPSRAIQRLRVSLVMAMGASSSALIPACG
jgi:hypothetical protein